MNFISRPAKLEDLYLRIQKVSGFTVEQLLDMFMAGYEMAAPKYGAIPQLMPENIGTEKKEAPTMQVTYNGFTGELVKLERPPIAEVTLTVTCSPFSVGDQKNIWRYDLSIYDSEKQVTHSFTGVKLEDVKFHGWVVTFGE